MHNNLFFCLLVSAFIYISAETQIDDSIQGNFIGNLVSDLSKEYFVDISNFLDGNTINIAFNFVNSNPFSSTFVMADFDSYFNAN
jgi:hypothetical protein